MFRSSPVALDRGAATISFLLVAGTLIVAVQSQDYQHSCYDCLYGNFLVEATVSECEVGYEYRLEMENCTSSVSKGCWSVLILEKERGGDQYETLGSGPCLEKRIFDCFQELSQYPAYPPRGVRCSPKVKYVFPDKLTALMTECPREEKQILSTTEDTADDVTVRICPCWGDLCKNEIPKLLAEEEEEEPPSETEQSTQSAKARSKHPHSKSRSPRLGGGCLSVGGLVAFTGLVTGFLVKLSM